MKEFGKVLSEIVLVCAVFCGSGTAVLADGCYFPDRAVKKLPEIPTQRALLTWKDGTETLVISSALDSEAQKLGWLIPLPSVPREMAKADPGALKTLAFCVQPRITYDTRDLSHAAGAVTLLVGWVILVAVAVAFRMRILGFFLVALLLLTLLLLFGGLGARTRSLGRAAANDGVAKVRVEKTAKVGAYEISVLKAGGAMELNRWLTESGFTPLPAVAEPMVGDYVRRGWVFAAIKLTRMEAGANTPHPIKLVFSAQEPVYPWKLTTLAGGRPFLELFIAGPSRAAVRGLKTEFCQRLRTGSRWNLHYAEPFGVSSNMVFEAERADVAIGHSEIVPILWNDCVLTKLSGHLDSGRRPDDLLVHWNRFRAYQQHFYSTTAAGLVTWIVFVSVLGIVCTTGLLVCCGSVRKPDGRRFFFQELLPRTLLVALLAAVITYFCLPKIDAPDVQVIPRARETREFFLYELRYGIERVLGREPDLLKQDEHAIADSILDRRLPAAMSMRWSRNGSRLINLLQGGEVQAESSPGNFTIEKRDGKVVVSVYDQTGCPLPAAEY